MEDKVIMILLNGSNACVLGYSNDYLNKKLFNGLKTGSMCTLNAVEEIDLVKLLNIHKWSGMAKFCKSGGEACMVAIRIARHILIKTILRFVDIMDGMIGI